MLQMAFFLFVILCVAIGFSWLTDQPGSILINFAGYEKLFTPVEFVICTIVLFVGTLLIWFGFKKIIGIPAWIARFFKDRQQKRGLEALSSGLIAIGIGDRTSAGKYASQARKSLPNEPLTALLRAQNAQLIGDSKTARRIYEAMLAIPDTELLGLRGLFLEAQKEQEELAAYQFAEQAMGLDPSLSWAVKAVFLHQCKQGNWETALKTLETLKQYKHIERNAAKRRRAVLLTAIAAETEDHDPDKALEHAEEAHKQAPDLVPAADIAGRILISKAQTSKASKLIARTWKLSPHPDLAYTYGFARPGDAPRDRLNRTKALAAMTPMSLEGPIAVALAAIEAKDWEAAKAALSNLVRNQPTVRVCTLMARIEGEKGDQGRMREWLAKAVKAPRDPMWTAEGYVSERWSPVSPLNGEIDCFEWKVPHEALGLAKGQKIDVLPQEIITGDVISVESKPVEKTLEEEEVKFTPKYRPQPKLKKESETTPSKVNGKNHEVKETKPQPVTPVTKKEETKQTEQIEEETKKQLPKSDGSEHIKDQHLLVKPEEKKAPHEHRIYVPPRAPDDPGTG